MFDALLPERTAEDIVSGIVRVRLGSAEYALPELAMEPTDAWAARLDDGLVGLLGLIDRLGTTAQLAPLFLQARSFESELLDTLIAYDEQHVLPPKADLRKSVTHTQILFAVMGVWATTASPLGALVVEMVRQSATSDSSEPVPTSGLRETLGSLQATSDPDSPTGSSSTPSRTSTADSRPTSSGRSTRRGSGTSPRTTKRPTRSGSATSAAPRMAASAG